MTVLAKTSRWIFFHTNRVGSEYQSVTSTAIVYQAKPGKVVEDQEFLPQGAMKQSLHGKEVQRVKPRTLQHSGRYQAVAGYDRADCSGVP
jgi:hypothetical protein